MVIEAMHFRSGMKRIEAIVDPYQPLQIETTLRLEPPRYRLWVPIMGTHGDYGEYGDTRFFVYLLACLPVCVISSEQEKFLGEYLLSYSH